MSPLKNSFEETIYQLPVCFLSQFHDQGEQNIYQKQYTVKGQRLWII
jgi:hypothetical protein